MSLTRSASANLVPLISRLVLAAAFIPAGYDKIMGEPVVFEGPAAEALQRLGVGEAVTGGLDQLSQLTLYQDSVETGRLRDRIRPRTPANESAGSSPVPPPTPAPAPAPRPVPPNPKPTPPPVVTPPPVKPPPVTTAPEPVTKPPRAVTPPPKPAPVNAATGDGSAVRAKRLHRVTVMLLENSPLPEKFKPQWLAWAAAATELVGGGLILLGLVSRVWGLGLAITMAVAFYLTTLTPVLEFGALNLPMPVFNQAFTQIGLFALALGVAITGAGGLSIDRLLFRGGGYDDDHMLHLG